MYKIAVCDDEKSTCMEVEKLIREYCKNHCIRIDTAVFYSGKSLCDYLEHSDEFELLFLDIELPDVNGVNVGKFIRSNIENERMGIVYISSKASYALQLFQNQPLDFLIKPILYTDIEKVMKVFFKKSGIAAKSFECLIDKVYHRVPFSEIVYFNSSDKKITIFLISGKSCTFYGKLVDVMGKLPREIFLLIHKSYIVNHLYVVEYTYEWVKMINGDIINISKGNRKTVREQLLQYEQ
ncbi:MAG: LytTR family DNA-binding domain-containing protein [Lachnospiraceae bacterium]|nr:LytTR family DNA-binding domain-containing protein [Lachnospiraceae bacterium]